MLPEVKWQVGFMSVRNHTDQQTGEISCLIRLCRGSVYFAIFFFYRPERVYNFIRLISSFLLKIFV